MNKTISAGMKLKAKSACDHNCIYTALVVERSGSFAKVITPMRGLTRVKVHVGSEGEEFIYAHGRFSMAPTFKASSAEVA